MLSCKNESGPDVSNIKVNLQTTRFEKEFFAIDTGNLENSLQNIYNNHPAFFRDFTQKILGLSPVNDSGAQAKLAIKQFLHDYRPIYDSVMKAYPDLEKQEEEIELKREWTFS